jgi:tight adherence protein C
LVFIVLAAVLTVLLQRDLVGQRLAAVLGGRTRDVAAPSRFQQASESLGILGGSIRTMIAKSEKELTVSQKRLVLAGYRTESHLNYLYAAKVIVPVALCVTALITGLYHFSPFLVFCIALVLGYLAPDYWITHKITTRMDALRIALPDTLDLLVVCLEAGLSLDQAVLRASDELRLGHPVMADELGLVMLEVRAGKPRMDAWRSLTQRTDLEDIRLFVSILVQADQFGTGVSRTLRIHGDTIRTRRKQRVEEIAAKTAIKLIFPLVIFIFPALFVVTAAPAFMMIKRALESVNK